jgi:phospholipid-binding lipoprotein MlaA
LNRAFFGFNDVLYRFLLIPLGKGYVWLIPGRARKSVGNFFHNLKTPVYLANDLLQLKPKPFWRHFARFVVNSTVGLAGLFDPAQASLGLERTKTGFGDTLARYGAGYGVYLVLPVFGPSDLRHGTGLVADYFLNPVPYLTEDPATTAVTSFDSFQEYAPGAEKYQTLRRKVEDPYIFFRNLHLQGAQRDAKQ